MTNLATLPDNEFIKIKMTANERIERSMEINNNYDSEQVENIQTTKATSYDEKIHNYNTFSNNDDEDVKQHLSTNKIYKKNVKPKKVKIKEEIKSNTYKTTNNTLDKRRRKTIFDLDSYVSSSKSGIDIIRLNESKFAEEEHYSMPMREGIVRINLSPMTQKIIGCVIGENLTTEYPWIQVKTEIIKDNIDLYPENSDFLPFKDEIMNFPDTKIMIGYVPTSTEKAQFYMCITESGRDEIMHRIEVLRLEQENRVRNAVYKTASQWHEFGSSDEVDSYVKNTRPLFEIELETTVDFLNKPINLSNRGAQDQRDAYVELIPTRDKFENVTRTLTDVAVESTSTVQNNQTQTAVATQANNWCQYSPTDFRKYEEDVSSLKKFLDSAITKLMDIHFNQLIELMDTITGRTPEILEL